MNNPFDRLITDRRVGDKTVSGQDPIRPPFQRDIDKITFSSGFRRMQAKMQVFSPVFYGDFVRTRLTHSIEVSRAAASLGFMAAHYINNDKALIDRFGADKSTPILDPNALSDCCAAAGLAHDFGSLCFSHEGERVVRQWARESLAQNGLLSFLDPAHALDFTQFDGNALGFHLLVKGSRGRRENDLRLTETTVLSTVKYPRKSSRNSTKFNIFQADWDIYTQIAANAGLDRSNLDEANLHDEGDRFKRHPFVYIVEAADDLCYLCVDVEDAFHLGQIDYNDISWFYNTIVDHISGPLKSEIDARIIPSPNTKEEMLHNLMVWRGKCITFIIEACAKAFHENIDDILAGQFSEDLLSMTSIGTILPALREFSTKRIYQSISHSDELGGAKTAFKGILHEIENSLIAKGAEKRSSQALYAQLLETICDVSHLTDREAMSLSNGPLCGYFNHEDQTADLNHIININR